MKPFKHITTFFANNEITTSSLLCGQQGSTWHALSGDFKFSTAHPRVYPRMEWIIPAFASSGGAGPRLPTPEEWKAELARVNSMPTIDVIYNFEKNGLSTAIYAEKVIYLFQKWFNFFWIYFPKLTKLSTVCKTGRSERQKAVLKPVTLF